MEMRQSMAGWYMLSLTSAPRPLITLLTTWGDFKANAPESEAFDNVLMFIHDHALIAEVYRFCQASMAVTQFQRNIEQIQEHMWQAGALMEAAARRLEGANSINWIEDAMEELRRHSIHIQQQAREYEEGVTNRRFQHRGRRS
jgi:DNA-binding LytR/AlgR family response regulator